MSKEKSNGSSTLTGRPSVYQARERQSVYQESDSRSSDKQSETPTGDKK